MGHQVEYFIDLSPQQAREWLSTLHGWWAEPESLGELPNGEIDWCEQSLHVDLGRAACQIRIPKIKYSWLIFEDAASVNWLRHFEEWLVETLPGVRAIRLDELLRLEWEASTGQEWEKIENLFSILPHWLQTNGCDPRYFRLLPDDQPNNYS